MNRYRTLFLTERGQRHQQDALKAAPPDLDVVVLRQPARETLLAHLPDVVFLISERVGTIDAELITAAPRLKLIARLGSLAHDIDLDAARRAGIIVCTQPSRGAILVAEHAILQILALLKRLREVQLIALDAADWGPPRRTDEDTFAYNWSGRQDIGSLADRTVGILGFGEIGAELARRLQSWGCRVRYNRRRRLPDTVEAELGLSYAPLEQLLAESDFLVNLLPYFPETDAALGAEQLAGMKPGACLVSCGSGSVIDEAALAAALRAGRLAGAALDTFEWEPLTPDNPLRKLAVEDPMANVLLTPHTAAGAAPRGHASTRASEYDPITRYLRGEPIPHRLTWGTHACRL